jgi:hypothetical protein
MLFMDSEIKEREVQLVRIPVGRVELRGEYNTVRAARGLVVLVCANRRNERRSAEGDLVEQLRRARILTFRIDLMTGEEAALEAETEAIRRDVALLAERVRAVQHWAEKQRARRGLALGYYGSGAAACAALRLASKAQHGIDALVICEVSSDFEAPADRESRPVRAQAGADPELVCDLFKNWLWWENASSARERRSLAGHDRQSVNP